MSAIGRNASYNFVGAVLPLALAIGTVPLYLRLIGPDRYGVLAIAWLFLGYFGVFDLGLGRATSYRIAAQKGAPAAERAVTFWTASLVNPLIGIVGGILLYALARYFFGAVFKVDPSLRAEIIAGLPLLALAVPVATSTGTYIGTLQGRERFLAINVVTVVSSTLFQILPLVIAWLVGPSLPGLLAAALAGRLVAVVALGMLSWREAGRGHAPRISRERLRDLLGFGGWISISSLSGPLLVMSDRFMVGGVLGATAVGHYTIPLQIAQRVAVFPSAITTALFPRLSIATAPERVALGETASRLIAGALTPALVLTIMLSGPLLELWVGRAIRLEVELTAQILFVAYWLNALALVPCVQLQSSGRPDLVTKILLAQVPPYLLLLYGCLSTFGLAGCAIALAIRNYVDLLMQTFALQSRPPSLHLHVGLAVVILPIALPQVIPLQVSAPLALIVAVIYGFMTIPFHMVGNLWHRVSAGRRQVRS